MEWVECGLFPSHQEIFHYCKAFGTDKLILELIKRHSYLILENGYSFCSDLFSAILVISKVSKQVIKYFQKINVILELAVLLYWNSDYNRHENIIDDYPKN